MSQMAPPSPPATVETEDQAAVSREGPEGEGDDAVSRNGGTLGAWLVVLVHNLNGTTQTKWFVGSLSSRVSIVRGDLARVVST